MRLCNMLYLIPLAALCCTGRVAAQPPYCSQLTVTGTYALAYEGTAFMTPPGASQAVPLPGAGLGIVSIDSEGTITSSGYQTIGGSMAYYPTMPGTIKVNRDCTGTVVWTGGATATIVISNGGDEIHSMVVQSPLSPMVVYGTWNRISHVPATVYAGQCSVNSVFGTYALRQHGYVLMSQSGSSQPAPMPGASLAMASITQDGVAEGSGASSIGGQTLPFTVTGGTVQVKRDCTGTMSFTAVSQGRTLGQMQAWFVVLNGGDTLWTIALTTPMGKPVTLGTMQRISHATGGN